MNFILEQNVRLHPEEEEYLLKISQRRVKACFEDGISKASINNISKTFVLLSKRS